jgi:hypothetical protein
VKNIPLIKKLQEDAAGGAVGGGAVASSATPLFATMVRRSYMPKISVLGNVVKPKRAKKKRTIGVTEAFHDASSVMSQLKSLETKADAHEEQLTTFGLEDEHGNVVKVSVPHEEAGDFEKALRSKIRDDDDTAVEIAEVLFDLKNDFTIVDIEWADVVEDEEPIVDPNAPEEQPVDSEGDVPVDEVPPEPDTESVTSLLVQVIDMMRADAEARAADAEARKAEAKAKEADAVSTQAAAKVRQEEQILDMEAHEKEQRELNKEAKRLAKLAKWKHDTSAAADETEMDDYVPNYSKVSPNVEDEEAAPNPFDMIKALLRAKSVGK